jgi:hypothetical protein
LLVVGGDAEKCAIVCRINCVRVLGRTRGFFSAVADRLRKLLYQPALSALRGSTISVRIPHEIPCASWTSGRPYTFKFF